MGETTEILNNQGYSYMLRGDLVNARKKFLKAYEREPGNPTIANNLQLLNSSSRFHSADSCAIRTADVLSAAIPRRDFTAALLPLTLSEGASAGAGGSRSKGSAMRVLSRSSTRCCRATRFRDGLYVEEHDSGGSFFSPSRLCGR